MPDTRLRYSPTGIKAARRCFRRYFAYGVLRIRGESTKAQAIGVAVSEYMDSWFKAQQRPPVSSLPGELANRLIAHWPHPDDVLGSENHVLACFTARDGREYELHGYEDVAYLRTTDRFDTELVVGDHKTTSDLKWALTPDTLAGDDQPIVYASCRMADDQSLTHVVVRFVYVEKSGSKTVRPVEAIVSREAAERWRSEFERDLEPEMRRLHETSGLGILDIEGNFDACYDFGGCAYLEMCTDLTPSKRLKAKVKRDMSLKDKLKAQKAAKTDGKPTPKTDGKPSAKTDTAKNADFRAKLRAQKARSTKPDADVRPDTADAKPDADVRPDTADAKPDADTADTADAKPDADVRPDTADAKSVPVKPVSVKVKVTKPKTKKAKPDATAGTTATANADVRPDTADAGKSGWLQRTANTDMESVQSGKATPTCGIGVLYVNCTPRRAPFVRASELIARVHRELRADVEVADYRAIDYGKGPAFLATGMRELLQREYYAGVQVQLGSPESWVVIEVLQEAVQGDVVE